MKKFLVLAALIAFTAHARAEPTAASCAYKTQWNGDLRIESAVTKLAIEVTTAELERRGAEIVDTRIDHPAIGYAEVTMTTRLGTEVRILASWAEESVSIFLKGDSYDDELNARNPHCVAYMGTVRIVARNVRSGQAFIARDYPSQGGFTVPEHP